MATETTYNVIKVESLREISSAAGNDDIIINDADSIPLETKKISLENLALSLKDYVLPIASADVLGGIRVGEGLSINPATGVLRNDVYYLNDLSDVQVFNSKPNQVLTYDGAKWSNKEFQGVSEVIAGDGLSGGGDNGSVILHVNAGDGLTIENDRVNVNTGQGLGLDFDIVFVDAHSSLTFVGNQLSVNPGTAIILDSAGVSVNYGRGLRMFGPLLEPYLGKGLEFYPEDQIQVAAGAGLEFVGGHVAADLGSGLKFVDDEITASLGDGLKFVSGRITADLGTGMEFVGGKIDVRGKGDLRIRYGDNLIGTFNANQETNTDVTVPKVVPGDGKLTIVIGDSNYEPFTADQDRNTTIDLTDKIAEVAAPAGTVIAFAGTKAPKGYVKCNGSALKRSTYRDLYNAIGTKFGSTNSTTFKVPDLRGLFVRGFDDGRGVDKGRAYGSRQSDSVGPHSHDFSSSNGTVAAFQKRGRRLSMDIGTGQDDFGQYSMGPGNRGQKHAGLGTIAKSGSGLGKESRPENLTLLYCIKY